MCVCDCSLCVRRCVCVSGCVLYWFVFVCVVCVVVCVVCVVCCACVVVLCVVCV